MNLEVLFEDNHILAVAKPSGLIVQPDSTGDATLIDLAKAYRIEKENKPGAAFIGSVHRLDRPVSGVVLLAKTSKAAARLTEQFRKGEIRKKYLAVVHAPRAAKLTHAGSWTDLLLKNENRNRVRVVSEADATRSKETRSATTNWRVMDRRDEFLVLELEPVTGRSHQLRVQCSFHGMPIVGDVKYGSSTKLGEFLALHARSILFHHPISREAITVTAPLPTSWKIFPCSIGSIAD